MPYCKNCHHEISKFDQDICPYCGEKDPIDANYVTMDMTQHLDPQAKGYQLYKSKSQSKFSLLCCLTGLLGLHEFYLGFWQKGLFELIASLVTIAGVGTLLYFIWVPAFYVFLPPLGVLWLFYFAMGLIYRKKDNLKDANGEFLR